LGEDVAGLHAALAATLRLSSRPGPRRRRGGHAHRGHSQELSTAHAGDVTLAHVDLSITGGRAQGRTWSWPLPDCEMWAMVAPPNRSRSPEPLIEMSAEAWMVTAAPPEPLRSTDPSVASRSTALTPAEPLAWISIRGVEPATRMSPEPLASACTRGAT